MPILTLQPSYSSGGTTQYPAIGSYLFADIINATWDLGLQKTAAVSGKINSINTDFPSAPSIGADAVSVPTVTAPGVEIPATQGAGDVISLFDTKYGELIELLTTKFHDIQSEFFPNEPAAYAMAENWLKEAIQNPSVALPPDVAAKIYESERSRILDEASRASDAVVAQFASRRFQLPPGAALAAVTALQQKAQGELGAASRKLAELAVEMQKFNVEKLLSLRGMAMNACLDYVKTLAVGPEMASKVVGLGYDAQSKLISSAADFYRADIASAELTAKVAQFNSSLGLEAGAKNQAASLALMENKLKVLLTEVQATAQQATSLFNNINSGVSMGVTAPSTTIG